MAEEVNIVESITDLQQHIRKRLTEIEDLDERKDAREILLEGCLLYTSPSPRDA